MGLATTVPTGFEKFVYGSYIIRLRLRDTKEVVPRFLSIYLNSRFGQMQFDRLKTGSLQFNINRGQIGDIVIPKISYTDQQKIIDDFEERHMEILRSRQQAQSLETELSDKVVGKIAGVAGIQGTLKLRDFLGQ